MVLPHVCWVLIMLLRNNALSTVVLIILSHNNALSTIAIHSLIVLVLDLLVLLLLDHHRHQRIPGVVALSFGISAKG